jgi:DNA-binding response OmpR family regulator
MVHNGLPLTALVIEDNETAREVIRIKLNSEGFDVTVVSDGASALKYIERHGYPHIALVDLKLPDMDGMDLCQRFHEDARLPMIIISANKKQETVLQGLDYADDYMVKPFYPSELAKRAQRLLERVRDYDYINGPIAKINERLTIDHPNTHVTVDGKSVRLTPIEKSLLRTLLQHRGKVVGSSALILSAWGSTEVHEETLRVHIYRLRQKIEVEPANPQLIVTRRGVGYSFEG